MCSPAVTAVKTNFRFGRRPKLLRQSNAPPQVKKAGIAVKPVKPRIRGEVNGQVIRSLFVSSIEPGEGLIAIPQARVDDCHDIGRYLTEGLGILQPVQHFPGFRLIARDRPGGSACCLRGTLRPERLRS